MTIPGESTLDESISPGLLSRPLNGRWRDILVSGQHEYVNDSAAIMAVTLAMVGSGWDWPEYWAAMTEPTNRLPARYLSRRGKRRGRKSPFERLSRDWERAHRRQSLSPAIATKAEAVQEIGVITAAWQGIVLPGRTKVLDKMVIDYALSEANRRGHLLVSLARRDVSLAVGCVQETASASLRRLVERRYLELVSKGSGANASVYRIVEPPKGLAPSETGGSNLATTPEVFTIPPEVVANFEPPTGEVTEHDYWLHMGRSAQVLYEQTGDQGLTRAQLMGLTGLSRATVTRHLRRLTDDKLLERTEQGYVRTVTTATQTAQTLPVHLLGRHLDRAARVEADRAAWTPGKASRVERGRQWRDRSIGGSIDGSMDQTA